MKLSFSSTIILFIEGLRDNTNPRLSFCDVLYDLEQNISNITYFFFMEKTTILGFEGMVDNL